MAGEREGARGGGETGAWAVPAGAPRDLRIEEDETVPAEEVDRRIMAYLARYPIVAHGTTVAARRGNDDGTVTIVFRRHADRGRAGRGG